MIPPTAMACYRSRVRGVAVAGTWAVKVDGPEAAEAACSVV